MHYLHRSTIVPTGSLVKVRPSSRSARPTYGRVEDFRVGNRSMNTSFFDTQLVPMGAKAVVRVVSPASSQEIITPSVRRLERIRYPRARGGVDQAQFLKDSLANTMEIDPLSRPQESELLRYLADAVDLTPETRKKEITRLLALHTKSPEESVLSDLSNLSDPDQIQQRIDRIRSKTWLPTVQRYLADAADIHVLGRPDRVSVSPDITDLVSDVRLPSGTDPNAVRLLLPFNRQRIAGDQPNYSISDPDLVYASSRSAGQGASWGGETHRYRVEPTRPSSVFYDPNLGNSGSWVVSPYPLRVLERI